MSRTDRIKTVLGSFCIILILVAMWVYYVGCCDNDDPLPPTPITPTAPPTPATKNVAEQKLPDYKAPPVSEGTTPLFNPQDVKVNKTDTGTGGTQSGGGGVGGAGCP